ncbi:hypothetical protein N7E02_20700 [Aliirhizobium terrae]|uniref:hypothetical protein n=1 Tax=Terrirhizobium terrae TaxID=2926709 RepID=UPI002574FA0D|nr:hypothetical protein [Rhizobium sp. CC-CFT758]WJH39262.1 hypothetical protein N7E02_20700 [Rhizobium sp. CC-CFT758]
MSIVWTPATSHIHRANETGICEVLEMNSLKIFFNLRTRITDLLLATGRPAPDAFDHPDICAMDLRELADLPLPGLPLAVEASADQQGPMPLARCA